MMKLTLEQVYKIAEEKYNRTKQSRDKNSLNSVLSYCNRWGGHVQVSDLEIQRAYTARIVSARTGDSEKHCRSALDFFYKLIKTEISRKTQSGVNSPTN